MKHVLDSVSVAPTAEQVRHVKGSHIVVPRVHPEEHAYILQNADKRIGFVIPYQDHYTLIGTTDIPVDEYEHPTISEDEIDYLLELVNSYLAKPLTRADVVWSYSGVRPLHDDGSSDPAAVTRDYVFKVDALDGAPGPGRAPVLSIFGGKITTYRKLAEAALAHLAPYFPGMKPAWTRDAPLPGGDLPNGDRNAFFAMLCRQYPGLPAELLRGLARRHGSRAMRILGEAKTMADLGQDFGAGLTAREIDYLMAEEWARSADDVLWRRTKCGLPMTPAQRDAVAAYCERAVLPVSTRMSCRYRQRLPVLRVERRHAAGIRRSREAVRPRVGGARTDADLRRRQRRIDGHCRAGRAGCGRPGHRRDHRAIDGARGRPFRARRTPRRRHDARAQGADGEALRRVRRACPAAMERSTRCARWRRGTSSAFTPNRWSS